MAINYSFSRFIRGEELHPLFQQTSWAANRTPKQIQDMLNNTPLTLGVWDEDRLIGFARVLTDDCYRALIEDVVVDSAYRNRGIGRGLMETLLKRLAHVEEILLSCEDGLIPFYQKVGFQRKTHPFLHIWKG
ncbi:MAG: GNAT family N-acetyltransferase [Anaerolineae bacterium]|nr:GNAT family N-acetyltransferase [Anaerolineae bacterium]